MRTVFETITKAQQVLDHMRRRILTGALTPEGKIPAERDLAREYAVSRVTISKITNTLVQEGLLQRRGPKGTFVTAQTGRAATIQIGFIMQTGSPQEVNPIYEAIFRAFVAASHAQPVRVSFAMTGNWGQALPGGFDAAGLDALVVAGKAQSEHFESFARQHKPVIWVDEVESADPDRLVCMDNFAAGRMATEHLLKKGRRAILVLGYPVGSYRGFELRLDGYRKAHADAGVPVDERRILLPYYSRPEHVIELLRELEAQHIEYDSIFGLSDALGFWALEAMQRLGRKVPEEIAVLSVDGLPMGDVVRPRLTSVAQPVTEIGRCAFERIVRMLKGEETAGAERLAPALLVRDSA